MSHAATKWALDQRGLKPAAKIVLWQLCDRYHPDNGCFPSQEKLADDCEMSRSALNHHLAVLEERRLLLRQVTRNEHSKRQEKTRYRFPFESEWSALAPNEPSAESGHGAESGKTPEPSPENGESRVRNPDSNLVREPVIEPVEREGAREVDEEPTVPQTVERLKAAWPDFALENIDLVTQAVAKRTPAERQLLADRLPDFLAYHAEKRGKAKLPYLHNYVSQENRWRDLPVREKPKPTADDGRVPALTQSWWWCFDKAADLAATPAAVSQVQIRVSAALKFAGAWPVDPSKRADIDAAAKHDLVKSPKDGAHAKAWKTYWRTKGIDMPIPDAIDWVFLPPTGPPGTQQESSLTDADREFATEGTR